MSTLDPLARAFLVVDVIHDETGAPSPRLRFSATYGADGGDGTSDDSDLVKVAASKHFCFPEYVPSDLTSILPAERARPEQYTFSLTESDGSRTTGYCRRFLPPGVGARYPVVACILSRRTTWFTFFFQHLERAEEHIQPLLSGDAASPNPGASSSSPVAAYLRALCARPVPSPGALVAVPLPWHRVGTGFPSEASCRAPAALRADGHDPDVRFAPLMFQGVTVHATVALFAALCFERRVVISGGDLSTLSAAVHAAAASLFPMRWQHIFLPLTPAAFVEYLTAPMPFLVGLPTSLLPAMRALPTEEVFHLNLDDGEYTYFPEDLDALPTRPTRALQSALEAQMRSVRHDDAAIAAAFRKFFSAVLGPYRRYVTSEGEREPPNDAVAAGGLWLDQDAFEAAAPTRRTREMLRRARNTQMFEVFTRERLAAMSGGKTDAGGETTTSWTTEVDFDDEFAGEVALSDVMRAGRASAAAGAARAAAATRAAANYAQKRGAEYYAAFVTSSEASARTFREYLAGSANDSPRGNREEGNREEGNRGAPASAAEPSTRPRDARSFVGVERFRRGNDATEGIAASSSGSSLSGGEVGAAANTSSVATPAADASPSAPSSAGKTLAERVAAARARRVSAEGGDAKSATATALRVEIPDAKISSPASSVDSPAAAAAAAEARLAAKNIQSNSRSAERSSSLASPLASPASVASPGTTGEKWVAFGGDFEASAASVSAAKTPAETPSVAKTPADLAAETTSPIAPVDSFAQAVRDPFDSTPASASSAPLPPLIDPFDAFASAAPTGPAATPSPTAASDPGDELAAALGLLDANLAREPRGTTRDPVFGVGELL